jgi:hypothetical protein
MSLYGPDYSGILTQIAGSLEKIEKRLTPAATLKDEEQEIAATRKTVELLRNSQAVDRPSGLTATWSGGQLTRISYGSGPDTVAKHWIEAIQGDGKTETAQVADRSCPLNALDQNEPIVSLRLKEQQNGDPIAYAGPINVG